MITVAIVEDNAAMRRTLQEMLSQVPDLQCLAFLENAACALERLPGLRPDVVLMDIQLPGMSGVDCVQKLKDQLPETQFMMLTVFEDHELIFQSLRAGATGYLLKKHIPKQLIQSIRELHSGGSPMSNSIARKVVQAFQQPVNSPTADESLSLREEQILRALASGHRFKEIAADLEISFHTVRSHVQRIYKKLHVRTKTEAVHKYQVQRTPVSRW